ncbi:MAG: type II secretion system protein GspN [Gammaproteobacteria bacterium]|nr:type II secretion system protein GspN [Gammaproteobacteria bacterium]
MRKFLGLGLFFIVCLAIGLALNMPLVHVLAEVKLPANIRVSNFNGTILKGRIDVLEVNNLQATGLQYRNKPACVFTLKWCYHLVFDQGEVSASANALDQTVTLTNSNLEYPVGQVVTMFPGLLVKPTGDLEVIIDHLTMKEKKLSLESGSVIWKNAGVEGESIDLGEYRLSAALSKQVYNFTVRDNNALLKIDGKGVLKSNGQYNLDIKIESEPGLQNSIKTALEFVAKKRGLNQYSVSQRGTIQQRVISQLSFGQS